MCFSKSQPPVLHIFSFSLHLFPQVFIGGAPFHWRGPECNCPVEEVGHSSYQTDDQKGHQSTPGEHGLKCQIECYCCKKKNIKISS